MDSLLVGKKGITSNLANVSLVRAVLTMLDSLLKETLLAIKQATQVTVTSALKLAVYLQQERRQAGLQERKIGNVMTEPYIARG
jgi:hypothetical protein